MSDKAKTANEGRRNFLKLAAVAGPVAASTALGTAPAEAATEAEPEGTGLRKTAHVKAYLDSARF